MTWKRTTMFGGAAGIIMGLLMFMVALAVVPDSLLIFDVAHWPTNAFVDFLDAHFHILADSDSDAHYVRYWMTSLLCYWGVIGGILGSAFWMVFGRRRIPHQKAWTVLLAIAWLFIAGVLAWALFTIRSYGGHLGITQDISTVILALTLIVIALRLIRAFLRWRAQANNAMPTLRTPAGRTPL